MTKDFPEIFYGLHMVEGIAEYRPPGKPMYRFLVLENTIKNMDPTFAGKPVYLEHYKNGDVDVTKLREEADGFVVDSFFNKVDGKHWCKFLAITDRAKEAIKSGYVLSNAYDILGKGAGGRWHGVDYDYEVTKGSYEHLAIVNDPRYKESIILTPDQFKAYNEEKEQELLKLQNSLESESKTEQTTETKEWLMFFKKTKVENSNDLKEMSVILPKSKREVALNTLIEKADDEAVNEEESKGKPVVANGDAMVKVGESQMTVNQLVEKCLSLESSAKKNSEEEVPVEGEKGKEAANSAAPAKEEKPENTEAEGDKDKDAENSDEEKPENEEEEKEKAENALHYEAMKNAEAEAKIENSQNFELPADRVARGKKRYGSK